MAVSYLHGVETLQLDIQGQTISVVKSSVVAILGIAPLGAKNAITLCNSSADDAQFGAPNTGFNIPKTLSIIRQIAGGCPVLVVNVFDATINLTAIAAEAQTVANGALKLNFEPIGGVSVLDSSGVTTTYIPGIDFKIDAYGRFTVLSTAISNGTVLKFNYKKLNAASVTAAQFIGGIDAITGIRSGSFLFDTAFNLFGFNPKIFISPTFSTMSGVATVLGTMAAKFRGVYAIDAPAGTTVSGALAGRGPAGIINFNTSDTRAILLFPQQTCYDIATNTNANYPFSAFYAAAMVVNDNKNGYWVSPSNKAILGLTGSEINISANLSDASSEANTLNAAGITTVFNSFATGIKVWGNRNASYPTSTSAKNFINVQRTDDIVSESIELAALNFVDLGITSAFIDLIREAGNNFISTLIQRGALMPGSKIIYNPDDNSASELANGHIVFERIYMVPTPAERITFQSVLDITLLQSLK